MLSKLLRDKNITQKKIAENFDVSQQTISKWCRGKSIPSLKHIKALSKQFEIPFETLTDFFEEQKKIANETCGSMAISETDK